MTDLLSPSVEGGEPTWECGSELDGYRCSRPIGHKGMHRKRSMLGPTQEALHAAYDAGARTSEQAAPPLDVERLRRIVEALGGFLWMGNNLHNSGSETFREMYGHAMVDARAIYNELNAEYEARLSHPEQTPSRHAAWCSLPVDHAGLCEGDQ